MEIQIRRLRRELCIQNELRGCGEVQPVSWTLLLFALLQRGMSIVSYVLLVRQGASLLSRNNYILGGSTKS